MRTLVLVAQMGFDPGALSAAEAAVSTSADEVEHLRQRVKAEVEALGEMFHGRDAETFRSAWAEFLSSAETTVDALLQIRRLLRATRELHERATAEVSHHMAAPPRRRLAWIGVAETAESDLAEQSEAVLREEWH